jgi:hypothetical protein
MRSGDFGLGYCYGGFVGVGMRWSCYYTTALQPLFENKCPLIEDQKCKINEQSPIWPARYTSWRYILPEVLIVMCRFSTLGTP